MHQTEYAILDPKMYKPDLVFELEDKIVIFEFQSSYVDIKDKKRFRFYTALFDHIQNKSNKDIELHVLSTVEEEKVKYYCINPDSKFPIYIHSLKNYDADEVINRMNSKISSSEVFTNKELLMIGLLCFMTSDEDVEHSILNSAVTITNIPNLEEDIGQFVKGIILMLCDKFVEDELLNIRISNLVGGNMKIVEDYAQRRVDEKFDETLKENIVNLYHQNVDIDTISKALNVAVDFVKETLAL